MRDSDAHFPIDPVSRKIRTESSRKNTVIQFDHNSERFTFTIPRYIENHDMSQSNNVEIHYLNVDAKTKEEKRGVYVVDDLAVTPEDSDVVSCSWLISSNATQLVGTLNFIVRFECKENGVISYSWNTAIATVAVSPGIDGGEFVAVEYADILAKWKEELFAAGYINAATMQDEMATLRSRMDTFTSLKAGSTSGDAELMDIRTGADGTVYENAGSAVRAQNKMISGALTNISRILTFSSDGVESKNGYYNIRGEFGVSDSYRTLFLPVTTGDICRLSCRTPDSNSFAKCYFFKADKSFAGYVHETSTATDFVDEIVIVPVGVAYIAITSYFLGTYKLEKAVFAETLEDLATPKRLKGKTIVNFGDSIFGNRRPPADISTMLADLTGAVVYNCGFGGCRMAWHSSPNYDAFCMYRIADAVSRRDFTLQEEALSEKNDSTKLPTYFAESLALLKSIDFRNVDIVTIAYGTNDYMGDISLEDSADRYATRRFAGALRYSLEALLATYPHLKIFVCTPVYRFWMDDNGVFVVDSDTRENSNKAKLTDFVAKIKMVAEEYHLPIIDNYYTLGFNQFTRGAYYSPTDGTHPNEAGCKRIAENISAAVF